MSIHFTSAIVPHGLVTYDEWIIARHLFFYTIPLVFVPRLESSSSSFSPRIFLGSVLRFYIPYHLSTYPHILLDVKYGVHEGRWLPSTQRRPSFRLPIRHCFSALSPVFPAAMPSQFHNATVYGSCFSPCWSQFLELADSANMSLRHPTGTPSSRPLSIYRLSSVHRSYCIGAHRPDLCCRSRPGACGEGNHRIH